MADERLKTLLSMRYDFDAFKEYCQSLECEYPLNQYPSQPTLLALDRLPLDYLSNDILPASAKGLKALQSTADGNCLFNSASILLTGNESINKELHLKTCIELALNLPYYKQHPKLCALKIPTMVTRKPSYQSIEGIFDATAFQTECEEIYEEKGFLAALELETTGTAQDYRSCGTLQVLGLASVIGCKINTHYPDHKHIFIDVYENSFEPRVRPDISHEINLMWTSTLGWKDKTRDFRPNHFVPLFEHSVYQVLWASSSQQEEEVNVSIAGYFRSSAADKKRKEMESVADDEDVMEQFKYDMEYEIEAPNELPFMMPKKWYYRLGKNISSNARRDENRQAEETENIYRKGSIKGTLEDTIMTLKGNLKGAKKNSKESEHINAVIMAGEFIKEHGPLVKTQDVSRAYRQSKSLTTDVKEMSKSFFEKLTKYLPICQVYINGFGYLVEDRLTEVVVQAQEVMKSAHHSKDILEIMEDKIGGTYEDALQFLDTKRDRDVLRGILTKLTSIRFATKLEGHSSRHSARVCLNQLDTKLEQFSKIIETSQVVRTGLTNRQQYALQQRIVTARKAKEMRTIAEGRGRLLKSDSFPELGILLEGIFEGSGMESHPRLIDSTLYKAISNAMTMRKAREILLTLAPKDFNIALSSCFNYTQNYKAGTAQAKRHHDGKNVNARISLHAPPRTGVEKLVVNLHWSSANVNSLIDCVDPDDAIIDSKDAKCIVCADIAPVQRPGKTWKRRDALLPDHEWNQSQQNAVTPMAHLFLKDQENHNNLTVVRSGKAVVLINLSFYEPSSSFRCLNELFKLMIMPEFDSLFRNQKSGCLKSTLINVVDNGPAEQPASPLVQMLLVRIRKLLKLKRAVQVSYAEYHSKRNFVERVHAQENTFLSRHGPFKSNLVHSHAKVGSVEHRENMEAMAKEVTKCLSEASFGGEHIVSTRGVKDEEFVFDDEENLKKFLSLNEGKKDASSCSYAAKRNTITRQLESVWGISQDFASTYAEDYAELNDESVTWRDKYTICSIDVSTNTHLFPNQPVPDYVTWFRSGELHYLSVEPRNRLMEGLWNAVPALFLPTDILSMTYELFPEPTDVLTEAIAFLAWLPKQDVIDFFAQLAWQEAEELKQDQLREKLRKLDIYKKKKDELRQECRELKLDSSGTKTDLAERIALHKNIDLTINADAIYDGNLHQLPVNVTSLAKLNVGNLRSLLRYHNITSKGTKDELVLKIALLRSGRKHLINFNEKSRLRKLLFTIQMLISEEVKMSTATPSVVIRRKFQSPLQPEITSKKPRKMASVQSTYTKSVLKVPEHLTISNIGDMLKPLKQELDMTECEQNQDAEDGANIQDVEKRNIDDYESFFEIGAKVAVKWSQQDVAQSGWSPGWYFAEVEESRIEDDWIKIEYNKEPGSIYKVDVTFELANGTLKLK